MAVHTWASCLMRLNLLKRHPESIHCPSNSPLTSFWETTRGTVTSLQSTPSPRPGMVHERASQANGFKLKISARMNKGEEPKLADEP